MLDARILREITDTLRVLIDRADDAGSTLVRSILTTTMVSVREEAEKAAKESRPARRPGDGMRRLGEGG